MKNKCGTPGLALKKFGGPLMKNGERKVNVRHIN